MHVKKNKLYKDFLRKRTKEAEMKYKNYKNKLTCILRYSEKKYFNELLVNHKNNIKETWKILNSIIQINHPNELDRQYPTSFENNNIVYTDPKNIAYIGPNLAKI